MMDKNLSNFPIIGINSQHGVESPVANYNHDGLLKQIII